MRLDAGTIADIKARADLVALVEVAGVKLRRAGTTFNGPCPWCGGSARTTRFCVWPKEGRWRCFLCLRSGDAISFVQDWEGCDFRGAVERRYRLAQNRPPIDGDAAAAMSLDDHRRGFAIAMIGLISEFNAYLDHSGANPTADSVSYRQGTIWASPEDLNQLRHQMLAAIQPLLANTLGPDRLPYHLSPILFPAEPPAR